MRACAAAGRGGAALFVAAAGAAMLAIAGCADATARSPGQSWSGSVHPAGVMALRWRTKLDPRDLFQPRSEECASGVLVEGRLIIGSRGAKVAAIDGGDGRVLWTTPVSGGVDSEASFDAGRRQVYVGADDGNLYALDPASGAVRWTAKTKGAIERAPEITKDTLYLATAADRVVAIEAGTGKVRWQYEREPPDEFTISGYAAPRLYKDAVLAGFSDGYLVSLSAATGEVMWAKSLASASEHFVDVDSTPAFVGDTAFVSSYSGGLYALDAKDGSVRWRLGIEGVGGLRPVGRDRLYFAAPREGLHALTGHGDILWRQALTEAGDLTTPTAAGPYLVFSGSRAGVFVVERATGKLLQIFDPGHGACAAPTVDAAAGRLYVLGNGGTLYGLDIAL